MSRGYLLDTNISSEFSKPNPYPPLRAWMEVTGNHFLSAISVGELHMGLHLLPDGRRRAELQAWINDYIAEWPASGILPVTEGIAKRWGQLSAQRQRMGRPLPIVDGLIAATAIQHDLILVTRNTRDFANLELTLFNPWHGEKMAQRD